MINLIEDQGLESIFSDSISLLDTTTLDVIDIPEGIRLFVQTTIDGVLGLVEEILVGDSLSFTREAINLGGFDINILALPEPDAGSPVTELVFNYTRPTVLGPQVEVVRESITVVETEDRPTGLTLSNAVVNESSQTITVGTLQGEDPDEGASFTYDLIFDESGLFSIDGDTLVLRNGADVEKLERDGRIEVDEDGAVYVDLQIRVTDETDRIRDVEKTIQINDVLDNVILTGTGADERIFGDALEDILRGKSGDDFIKGKEGDDVLFGEQGNDRVIGGAGLDVVLGGSGDDLLYGNAEDDRLNGNDGNDTLYGGGSHDNLFGSDGMDFLFDGTGLDRMRGGEGTDFFMLEADDQRDWIRDYEIGVDQIFFGNLTEESEINARQESKREVLIMIDGEKTYIRSFAGELTVEALMDDLGF